jgi:phytoene/squalene synthetase
MPTNAVSSLEDIVRSSDPDRYIATLFAPAEKRSLLFALYALNHELGHIAEAARDPMMAEIRLQWWRDALEEARAGKPRGHDVLQGMAEVFAHADVPAAMLDAMIDARSFDASYEFFADMAALETYADATSGNLMRIAARILGDDGSADMLAREAGISYALCGILRALPFHAGRRKLFLPVSLLADKGLTAEDIFSGQETGKIKRIIGVIGACATEHLDAARKLPKPGQALAAFLSATTVPAYLKVMTRRNFNPFRDRADILMLRRQLAILRASLRGCP